MVKSCDTAAEQSKQYELEQTIRRRTVARTENPRVEEKSREVMLMLEKNSRVESE